MVSHWKGGKGRTGRKRAFLSIESSSPLPLARQSKAKVILLSFSPCFSLLFLGQHLKGERAEKKEQVNVEHSRMWVKALAWR